MELVKVSPKFQVVIPQSIRKALNISAGERIHVLQYENRIEYIPEKKMKSMRGFLRGIESIVERETDRV